MIDDCIFVSSDPLPSFTFKPVEKVFSFFLSLSLLPLTFSFIPFLIFQENFDSFVNCLKAIVEKKDFDPLILEVSLSLPPSSSLSVFPHSHHYQQQEDEGDMDDENQDGASSLPPITNISLQHEKCTKVYRYRCIYTCICHVNSHSPPPLPLTSQPFPPSPFLSKRSPLDGSLFNNLCLDSQVVLLMVVCVIVCLLLKGMDFIYLFIMFMNAGSKYG